MRRAPERRRAAAHAWAVAPDVYTSSTRQIRSGGVARTSTLPRTFRRRSSSDSPRCRGSVPRAREQSATATPQSVASADARERDGTSPRSRARSGSPGTGTRRVDIWCAHDLHEEPGCLAREPPASTLLPRAHQRPSALVVHDRRARAGEGEPSARALGAASDGPGSGRAAALHSGGLGGRRTGGRRHRARSRASDRRRNARGGARSARARTDATPHSVTPSCRVCADPRSDR